MYEYRVVEAPAPTRRGWFSKATSYAETLADAINEQAIENWEFQRAECGLEGNSKLLIFRKAVAKADQEMAPPKRFSDRLIAVENKAKQRQGKNEDGSSYSGPVRPRRARVLLDDEGTMTDRPENVANDTVKLAAEAHEPPSAAERITPFKPSSAGTASR